MDGYKTVIRDKASNYIKYVNSDFIEDFKPHVRAIKRNKRHKRHLYRSKAKNGETYAHCFPSG